MRVAIIGSRYYPRMDLVRKYVRALPAGAVVVMAKSMGVETVAGWVAERCGLDVELHVSRWATYGRKKAALIRDDVIIRRCDKVAVFFGISAPRERHAIALAEKHGKPVEIIRGREEVGP